MKKQPEITEQTRNNIVTAFCRLYQERPIEQIHVKDVIALAGYNRSTFYEYFQDIYALLSYLEDDVIHYIKTNPRGETPIQSDLLHLLSEKEDFLKVLLGPFGCVHFQDRLKQELLPQNSETGSSSPLQPYLSEFHLTVSLSLYRLWLQREKDIPLDELTALIHTLYTAGADSISNLQFLN